MAKGYVYFRTGAAIKERDQLLQQENIVATIHHSANQIQFDGSQPAAQLPHGQAFGPEAELRWWPDGSDQWELLLICDKQRPDLNQPPWHEEVMDVDEPDDSVFLWGQHWASLEGADEADPALQDWGWVQAQVEADLHYPVEGSKEKPAVVVKARTYRQRGLVRLTRFVSLKPAPGKEVSHGTTTV